MDKYGTAGVGGEDEAIELIAYSLILARISESRKRVYSSSPTLMGLPPNCRGSEISLLFQFGGARCARGVPIGMGHGRAGGATYHGDEDLVTGGDAHGEALAVLVEGTGANGEDLSLVLLLDTALREEDAGGSLGLGLDALDQDAVEEGSKALDVAQDRLLRWESVSSLEQMEQLDIGSDARKKWRQRCREHQLGDAMRSFAGSLPGGCMQWVCNVKETYHCDGVGGLKGQELEMRVGWRREDGSVRGKIWTLHREISRMPRPQLRRGPNPTFGFSASILLF